ncbi:MAG: site-2 protease family protein [Promethearchaeota archaeon]
MIYSQFNVFTFLLFLLLFWFFFWGISKLLKLEKRGWDVGPGYFMAKTTRLNRFINKIANRFPRFWRVLWTIGIGFGFGVMILGLCWLTYNLYALLTAPQPENALIPFIPGVTVTGSALLYMILPIAIIMLSHELAHGIACRIGGVKVKSSGILAFILLFGAFVEPDDDQIKQKKRLTRQQIYAAGSFANLIVAFFAMFLLMNMYKVGDGVYLKNIPINGPAYGNLYPNEIILGVNGTTVDFDNLSTILDHYHPFDPILFTVRTENGTISNRTFIVGFNRKKLDDTSWNTLEISNGSYITGALESLNESDQHFLTLNSSNNFLNFSLIINTSTINVNLETIIALAVDISLNASIDNFNTSMIQLINFSNPIQNYELFSLQNLSSGVNETSNISQVMGYNITDYFNTSHCLNLNFVFNYTTDFTVWVDLCRIYLIENNTESYFGITYTTNLIDRELAIILGPLAPHVYQMLIYLYMFSLAVAVINLLPIPPFDGNYLFVSLFETSKSAKETSNQEEKNDPNNEKPKPKEPWTWRKTVIWSVRSFAIFIFLSNIILSIILFDIFTLFSSLFT